MSEEYWVKIPDYTVDSYNAEGKLYYTQYTRIHKFDNHIDAKEFASSNMREGETVEIIDFIEGREEN